MTNEHKDALLRVIDQRIDILERVIGNCNKRLAPWYYGRRAGLQDARELLKCSLEELLIELNEA